MTLFKQIALLVTILYFILASVILVNDFKNASVFMQGQLKTTAQDMATTLGISISNHPSGGEASTLEVLFNSVFDSGYYTNIELISVEQNIIHRKTQTVEVDGVPSWFMDLIDLQPATGSTQVIKGWSQLGQLNLTLHPGIAYSGLYQTLNSTIKWSLAIFIISIIFLWLLLHYLLKPLKIVQKQANEIHNNKFVLQEKIPSTLELKTVVVAMNRMVGKIQSVFNEQQKTLSDYQDLLFKDKLTGLGNRRFMLDLIAQSMKEGSSFHGCLAIIKLVHFDEIKEKLGFDESDALVKSMASIIQQKHNDIVAEKVSRLSDDEFAVLVSRDDDLTVEYVESVFNRFKEENDLNHYGDAFYMISGVSSLDSKNNAGDLLADVDYCLTSADDKGPYSVYKNIKSQFDLPQGKMQWRSWLDDALKTGKLFLVGQEAVDLDGTPQHKEMFVRLKNEKNQILPASAFMPMATGLGLSFEIDKEVFKLANQIDTGKNIVPMALNLSSTFFDLPSANQVLDDLLQSAKEKNSTYCFESSHHVLQQHAEMSAEISEKVRGLNHQFGLDNLDFSLSLQILQTTRFDYVKISAQTLCDMNNNKANSPYQALKTMTTTLDIDMIAVGVDSQELYDQIQQLGIRLMQGNFLSMTEEQ